ncbi:Sjogren's syndrome/scleroderma autoantigen 1 family protein [Halorubrum sp. AD140]|uniref:Sjogren's syndrome/scleroderma autoantigen 1 family protein n=1 Tax=Halorubrum sp. AD140 TaxID=3050073 RepID=UPI002ACCB6FB|nr:Sjogren's syndrome/scleroderma autoantigen 1 family protein [Halorubrum sp. AD140]MDZ5812698.1 Sjogren's syndrome/scleroderma autoantigen 1 family protein [Halorubrum sp. AD140]
MSDGFDKEAEREKLREKLADDEQKREHTQRMSELLLRGATMTNRHCDDCGDPIFRQDGREFCPTCHTVDAADVEGNAADASDAPGDTTDTQRRAVDAPGDADPPTGENGAAGSRSGTPDPSSASNPSSAPARVPDRPEGAADPVASPADVTGSESVADARASLARTLNRFAVAAEETDDPRRARDHLQAAREAAEALAALDR